MPTTPVDSGVTKQSVTPLRKLLTDPQCEPATALKEWVREAEHAEIRNHRMELKLLLNLLDRIAFPMPLQLQAYQIYYQGFLHELDGEHIKAGELYQQGAALIQGQPETDLLTALFNRGLGHCLLQKGESAEAEKLLLNALDIAQTKKHRITEAATLRVLSYCYYKMGQITKSIECCQQAIIFAKEIDTIAGESAAYNILGLCYISSDRLEEGRQALERAAALRQALGNSRDLGIIYLNLGLVHERLGEYKAAIEAAQMAVTLASQIGNQSVVGLASLNLSLYYTNLQDFEKAGAAATRAIQIFQEQNEPGFLLAAFANKSIACGAAGKLAEAQEFLGQAEQLLETVKQKKNNTVLATLYLNLNQATLLSAETAADFAKAFTYRDESLALFEQLNDQSNIAGLLEQNATLLLKSAHRAQYKQIALADMQKAWQIIQKISGADYSKAVDMLLLYADLLAEEGLNEQSFEIYSTAFKYWNTAKAKQDKRKLIEYYSKAAKLTSADKAIPLIEQAIDWLKAENGDPTRLKELSGEINLLRKQQPKNGKWFLGKH